MAGVCKYVLKLITLVMGFSITQNFENVVYCESNIRLFHRIVMEMTA